MYLLARQGALYRFRDHSRVPRGELDRHFADYDDGITVLVPSYAEEPQVVRATLWSAALQEFPDLKVVLLLDDPPVPTDPAGPERLPDRPATSPPASARPLRSLPPGFNAALDRFRERLAAAIGDGTGELRAAHRRVRVRRRTGLRTWPRRSGSRTTWTNSSWTWC